MNEEEDTDNMHSEDTHASSSDENDHHQSDESFTNTNDAEENFTGMVPPQGTADGCSGAFFTSDNQLADAQDNEVALSGQNAEVKTWTNQLGPQGTANEPYGHNLNDSGEPAMF